MKKRLFLILSVTVMLAAGCGNKDNAAPDIEAGAAETVTDTVEPDMAEDKEAPDADQAENGDAGKEQAETEAAEEKEPADGDKEAGETQEPKPASEHGGNDGNHELHGGGSGDYFKLCVLAYGKSELSGICIGKAER